MKILIACEYSGIVRDAFLAQGHEAISADLLPTERPGPHYQGNVLDIINDGYEMLIAHPPCTRLANSGVRWLQSPPKGKTLEDMQCELQEGAEFYNLLRNAPIKYKAIENPIMHKYARQLIEPIDRQIIQPWQFGEPEFKATGFELQNLPDLVPTEILTRPEPGTLEYKKWSRVHLLPPSPERWKERSRTMPGIALAMAAQWPGKYHLAQMAMPF